MPNIAPVLFPINNPINSVKTIIRFGIIPPILNQEKKFNCKKYIIKNVNNKIRITLNFRNLISFKL